MRAEKKGRFDKSFWEFWVKLHLKHFHIKTSGVIKTKLDLPVSMTLLRMSSDTSETLQAHMKYQITTNIDYQI